MSDMKAEAVQNAEVNDDERAVVRRLVEEANNWQSAAPHGLDFVMERVARLVRHVDQALTQEFGDQANPDIAAERARAVLLMHEFLSRPPVLPKVTRIQAQRRKLHGNKKSAELAGRYDVQTLQLLAEDWPAWLEEVELGGFIKSLGELVREYDKTVAEFKARDGMEPEKLHFMVSFEMRHKFGKVEPELIEALEFLGKEMREAEA